MSGTMIPLAGIPFDPWAGYLKQAQLDQAQAGIGQTLAQTGLIGAQTGETQARSGLIGAQTSTEGMRPAQVGAETNLLGAQRTKALADAQEAIARAKLGIPASAAASYGSANQSNAAAGLTQQQTYAAGLTNLWDQQRTGGMMQGIYGTGAPPAPPPMPGYKAPSAPTDTKPRPVAQLLGPEAAAPRQGHIGFDSDDPMNAAALAQIKDPLMRSAAYNSARVNNIPLPWFVAQGLQESGWNRNAPRGGSGEYGPLQIMPATGRGIGYTEEQLANPTLNVMAGGKYLRQKLDEAGNNPLVAAGAYNTGTAKTATAGYMFGGPGRGGGIVGHMDQIAQTAQSMGGQRGAPGAPGAPGAAPEAHAPQVSGNAFYDPRILPIGEPIPKSMAAAINVRNLTPEAIAKLGVDRQLEIGRLYQSIAGPDPTVESHNQAVDALFNNGLIFRNTGMQLLNRPDLAGPFMQQQLPLHEQAATAGAKTEATSGMNPRAANLFKLDEPQIKEDAAANTANLQAAMAANKSMVTMKEIRDTLPTVPTGALGAERMAIGNFAATFGGPMSQRLLEMMGAPDPKATASMQEVNKLFLNNVVSQEQAVGNVRIGAMFTNFFAKASPSIDMQKPAIKDILNLGMVGQQMAKDYAEASNQHYSTSRGATADSLVSGQYKKYQPLSNLEAQWLKPDSVHSPDVYVAAAALLNGKPAPTAFHGLTENQQVEALHIIRRIDPSAVVKRAAGQ